MEIKNTITCPLCGRGFNVVLSVWGLNVEALGRGDDTEIYEMVMVPAGDPEYARKRWDCPRCGILKKRVDVDQWLVGEGWGV